MSRQSSRPNRRRGQTDAEATPTPTNHVDEQPRPERARPPTPTPTNHVDEQPRPDRDRPPRPTPTNRGDEQPRRGAGGGLGPGTGLEQQVELLADVDDDFGPLRSVEVSRGEGFRQLLYTTHPSRKQFRRSRPASPRCPVGDMLGLLVPSHERCCYRALPPHGFAGYQRPVRSRRRDPDRAVRDDFRISEVPSLGAAREVVPLPVGEGRRLPKSSHANPRTGLPTPRGSPGGAESPELRPTTPLSLPRHRQGRRCQGARISQPSRVRVDDRPRLTSTTGPTGSRR